MSHLKEFVRKPSLGASDLTVWIGIKFNFEFNCLSRSVTLKFYVLVFVLTKQVSVTFILRPCLTDTLAGPSGGRINLIPLYIHFTFYIFFSFTFYCNISALWLDNFLGNCICTTIIWFKASTILRSFLYLLVWAQINNFQIIVESISTC